jgi:hypothetical protein
VLFKEYDMSGQLFQIGQAVTPISDPTKWNTLETDEVKIRPKFGEVYHVSFYNQYGGYWWIALKELPQQNLFLQEGFAPVMGDEQLEKMLTEVMEEELV